jgi:hypothetical protein
VRAIDEDHEHALSTQLVEQRMLEERRGDDQALDLAHPQ